MHLQGEGPQPLRVRREGSFYGMADVGIVLSLAMTLAFLASSLGIVVWIFRTGYRLKA